MIYVVEPGAAWALYRRCTVLAADLRDSEGPGPLLFDGASDLAQRYAAVRRELLRFGVVVPAAADPWPDPRGWLSDRTMAAALGGALRRLEALLAPPGAPTMAPYGTLCC